MKTTLLGCFRKLVFPAALGLVAIAIGAGPAAATYPGANGRIVFTTGTNDLWSVLDDGSGLELLTTVVAPPGVSSFASYPSFSADGSKIAVMLNELDRPTPCDPGGINGGSGPCRALILMNADGSNQQVVYQSEDIASLQLSLSPDGREIAFTKVTSGSSEQIHDRRGWKTPSRSHQATPPRACDGHRRDVVAGRSDDCLRVESR